MAHEKPGANFQQIFLREVAKVIPWGVGLLVVLWVGYFTTLRPAVGEVQSGFAAFASLIVGRPVADVGRLSPADIAAAKGTLKAAIRFAQANAIEEIRRAATDPRVVTRARQNAKEAIEFAADRAVVFGRRLLFDPQLAGRAKQNLRESLAAALEVAEGKVRRATWEDPAFVEKLKRNARETLDFAAERLAHHGALRAGTGRPADAALLQEMRQLREELIRLRQEMGKGGR